MAISDAERIQLAIQASQDQASISPGITSGLTKAASTLLASSLLRTLWGEEYQPWRIGDRPQYELGGDEDGNRLDAMTVTMQGVQQTLGAMAQGVPGYDPDSVWDALQQDGDVAGTGITRQQFDAWVANYTADPSSVQRLSRDELEIAQRLSQIRPRTGSAFGGALGSFGDALGDIGGALTPVAGAIGGAVTGAAGAAAEGVTGTLEAARPGLIGLAEAVKPGSDIIDALTSAGQWGIENIAAPVADAAQSGVDSVLDTAGNVTDTLQEAVADTHDFIESIPDFLDSLMPEAPDVPDIGDGTGGSGGAFTRFTSPLLAGGMRVPVTKQAMDRGYLSRRHVNPIPQTDTMTGAF